MNNEKLIEDARRSAGALEEFEFEGVAGDAPGLLNRLADLAAGFRRSEVPEPSVEQADWRDKAWNAASIGRTTPTQGEPSDAQVGRAVVAYRDERNRHGHMNSDVHFRCMRAALRAAWESR